MHVEQHDAVDSQSSRTFQHYVFELKASGLISLFPEDILPVIFCSDLGLGFQNLEDASCVSIDYIIAHTWNILKSFSARIRSFFSCI